MIDKECLFNEIKNSLALKCRAYNDATDLINMAETVVLEKIPVISAPPESIGSLWAWLEKEPVKIWGVFCLEMPKESEREQVMSNLSSDINQSFKKGADGAQIFIKYSELESFVSELLPIREDLFFNKGLCIGLNLDEIAPSEWTNVFLQLKIIRADALMLGLSGNKKNNAGFVGHIYGLMEHFDPDFGGELHFSFGNDYVKIEQAWRLAEKMRPELAKRLKFFLA
ncbi:MAG: hypothetical protein LBD50_00260 [Rickettsiales bacterium]|jgi:hypothetical protein|nr:hypothetical protein [Rickettsiales bacterium]